MERPGCPALAWDRTESQEQTPAPRIPWQRERSVQHPGLPPSPKLCINPWSLPSPASPHLRACPLLLLDHLVSDVQAMMSRGSGQVSGAQGSQLL